MTEAVSTGIVIDGLRKRFAGQTRDAVAPLYLTLPTGSITGLVGPDGAGKTTLLRLLMGLLQADEGQAWVNGWACYGDLQQLHAHVGYMPQKFGLYEDLSVSENMNLYADLRSVFEPERSAIFERLLALTDLHRFTERPAGKLSGGMKQKLGLACTLLGKPEVLLLDEPGVGVDPISRRELWRMVRELAQGGMTVLWSTAYLDEAELCDHVCLMNEGVLLAHDRPQALMRGMHGRVLSIAGLTEMQARERRSLLRRALASPEVMDGVIQGQNVRVLLRNAHSRPDLQTLQVGPQAQWIESEPRLEDAFIDRLGGGPGGESVLASVFRQSAVSAVTPTTAPCGSTTVIEARQLSKRFGDFVATDQVSFAVQPGEIFGLLGPNGAGKSTTFKMECGLLKPTSGQALIEGIDIKTSPTQARQRLGYMAQKFALYTQLTVQQNLRFFSGIYGLRGSAQSEKIAQMVQALDLTPYVNSTAALLPLGFKQRLALACAVMHIPQVLFLDEPTSGVDPVTRREFWTHINALADLGVTIMVTTHFMDEAEYCDRIALIHRGQLLALGTPDELKACARSPQCTNPSMEDAFIFLVEQANGGAAHA